jgi:hypothetical protein
LKTRPEGVPAGKIGDFSRRCYSARSLVCKKTGARKSWRAGIFRTSPCPGRALRKSPESIFACRCFPLVLSSEGITLPRIEGGWITRQPTSSRDGLRASDRPTSSGMPCALLRWLRIRFSRWRLPESALRRKAHQRVLYAGSAMRPDDNEWKRKTMGDVRREDIGSADGSCPATCRRWPRSKSQEAPPWPSAGVPAIARRRRSRVSGCYKAVRIVRPPTGILRRSSGSVAHHPWQLSVAPRPVLEASSC